MSNHLTEWAKGSDVEMLRKRYGELKLSPTTNLSVATGEFDTVDEMVELVAAKLQGYPERLQLWAVDSNDPGTEGWTVCLTGNGPSAKDNAEWIALLLIHGPGLIERCRWLEKELLGYGQRLAQERIAHQETREELNSKRRVIAAAFGVGFSPVENDTAAKAEFDSAVEAMNAYDAARAEKEVDNE